MNAETVNRLVQEVHDLLDVSSVGLYEFMDMLNTPDQPLSLPERKALARQVLERLITEPGIELTWLRWPEWTSLAKVTMAELPADPWDPPDDDGRYLALDRAQ